MANRKTTSYALGPIPTSTLEYKPGTENVEYSTLPEATVHPYQHQQFQPYDQQQQYQPYQQYQPGLSTLPQRQEHGTQPKILGLRKVTFILSVSLAVVVILAAVGGGLGGALAAQNAKK
jgi:hypothetical protein